ncbi:Glycosyl transferase family 4 [Parafrankia sp. Ea1.12]|uniref:MraY family glycosyltransferase n=1 Tax=Parafrankia sp. Ea1.12 TaxID=573499 RepID=UPI000DA44AEC|nr:glycosyltransferase family 4 protein [Parafrankia sp. Ea1.12]SQD97046.1 Glycosyl transferase family 4 [Parafrankia sp. Ea1.12]
MVGAGAAALLVTLAATPAVLVAMRRLAAIDDVNERSSHQVPTPRGGGVAVALGLFAGVLVLVVTSGRANAPDLLPMTVGVTLFGLIGLAEDIGGDVGGITPLRRLALQVLASLAVSTVLLISVTLDADPPAPLLLVAALVGPLWVTGFVNAFNFMDGINGISAAQAAIAGLAFSVVGRMHDMPSLVAGGAVITGAAIGFGPFNFPRARIFLGDVGSYTLGACLAVLALQGVVSGLPPDAAVAPLLLYLTDTGITLIRRVRRGERWYLPHRTHIYQQLTDVGWTHTRVTVTVACLVTVMSGLGLLAARGGTGVRVAADLALLALIVGYSNAPRIVGFTRSRARIGRAADPVLAKTTSITLAHTTPVDITPPENGTGGLVLPHQRQTDDPRLSTDSTEPAQSARPT